jgi:hypothetical protein
MQFGLTRGGVGRFAEVAAGGGLGGRVGGEDFEVGGLGVIDDSAVDAAQVGEIDGGGDESLATAGGTDKHELVVEAFGNQKQHFDFHRPMPEEICGTTLRRVDVLGLFDRVRMRPNHIQALISDGRRFKLSTRVNTGGRCA